MLVLKEPISNQQLFLGNRVQPVSASLTAMGKQKPALRCPPEHKGSVTVPSHGIAGIFLTLDTLKVY